MKARKEAYDQSGYEEFCRCIAGARSQYHALGLFLDDVERSHVRNAEVTMESRAKKDQTRWAESLKSQGSDAILKGNTQDSPGTLLADTQEGSSKQLVAALCATSTEYPSKHDPRLPCAQKAQEWHSNQE